jgi:hypothetical protein
MSMGARDKMILAFVPALLTVGIYSWMYARPMTQEVSGYNRKLAEMDAQPVNPILVAEKTKTYEVMSAAVSREKARASAHMPHAQLPSPVKQGDRSGTLRVLSRQLSDAGLQLVTSQPYTPASTARTAPTGSTGQQGDIEWLAQKQNLPAPEYWRIELVGSYGQMLAALRSLSSTTEFIVPLTIEMESANKYASDGKALQKWVLVVWI